MPAADDSDLIYAYRRFGRAAYEAVYVSAALVDAHEPPQVPLQLNARSSAVC
jgi:hypothetical protein